ncbi:MAG: LCP family protein [Clostridia bacterium]|nr:LCP family protein [Clostridia bacterium]
MKFYLKVFISSLVVFSLIFSGAFYMITKNAKDTSSSKPPVAPIVIADVNGSEDTVSGDDRTELERLVDASDRVNVVAFGTDGGRADTIMFLSYSPSDQLLDVVSIPRDTYHAVAGHDLSGQKKINAVYGFKENGGSLGMKDAVSTVLNVPVDYYIKLDYRGVENIIDVLGGVQINVFKDLKYDDPWSDPPLHIDIPAGKQLLNGEKSVEYLRWRKNNGEAGDGDIGRIQRQQEFVIAAAKRAFSFKLPVVIKTTFNYLKTDMGLDTMLYYGTTATDFDFANLKTYRLPGDVTQISHVSYMLHDPAETEQMMIDIYNRVPGNNEAN